MSRKRSGPRASAFAPTGRRRAAAESSSAADPGGGRGGGGGGGAAAVAAALETDSRDSLVNTRTRADRRG